MSTLKIFNKHYRLPQQKWLRILLGILLILGGALGFLPVVGFWMLPLGIVILSMDFATVRRLRRRIVLKWSRWKKSKAKQ